MSTVTDGMRTNVMTSTHSSHHRVQNFSKSSLPYQSSQERCVFQIHKYILQILTQIGHPVGSKVVTKYLLELAHHPNADIPSQVFSKVIKMNTAAKKYTEIHELTKVRYMSLSLSSHPPIHPPSLSVSLQIMILRNRSLYVDDIFHVISSFLATKDYDTAYKIILYAVKQDLLPPPHLFCTLCVTIGNSPLLNERTLMIAEKSYQLMSKLYGSEIIYSSYWTTRQEGCLLRSRIKWLVKLQKISELKKHLVDCESRLEDGQRVIDLCSTSLGLIPPEVGFPLPSLVFLEVVSQESELREYLQGTISKRRQKLKSGTGPGTGTGISDSAHSALELSGDESESVDDIGR